MTERLESSLAGTLIRLAMTVLVIWIAGLFLRAVRALFRRPDSGVRRGNARRAPGSPFDAGAVASGGGGAAPADLSPSISEADIVDVPFTEVVDAEEDLAEVADAGRGSAGFRDAASGPQPSSSGPEGPPPG